jgi:hypothetical protein
MFLDMSVDRNEIPVDELCGFGIRIRLGLQPSTGTSSRRGTEVKQDGLFFLFRQKQRLIDILTPVYGHVRLRNDVTPVVPAR